MKQVIKQNLTTNVELTEKERRTLRHIIDKFYTHLEQSGRKPVLMREEDAALIEELGDLAKDICIINY